MFFNEQDITEEFICKSCNFTYSDPRILPCGQTVCFQCIEELIYDDKVSCSYCYLNHSIPDNGFPVNMVLVRLMKKKPEEVYRGQLVEEYKKLINLIKQKSDDLKENSKHAIDSIKNYCSNLRNDLQLSTELSIQTIKKYHEDLIKKINDYERTCVDNYEKNNENSNEIKLLLEKTSSFYEQQTSYLKRYQINETEVRENFLIANQLITKLDTEHALFKSYQFNGSLLRFQDNSENIQENVIGSLYNQKLICVFPNLKVLDKVNIKNMINSFFYSNDMNSLKLEIQRIENDCFLIFYSYRSSSPCLVIINSKGKLLCKTSDNLSYCFDFKITTYMNLIFVYSNNQNQNKVLYSNGNFNNTMNTNLRCYDNELKLKHKKMVRNDYSSISANSEHLFCLNQNDLSIYVLDHCLNPIKTIRINVMKKEKPFYLNSTVHKMLVDNNNFYFKDDSNFIVMNILNGKRLAKFKIECKNFILFNSTIVCIDEHVKELCYFSLNGNLIKKQSIDFWDSNENLQLIETCDKISFFDSTNEILYF